MYWLGAASFTFLIGAQFAAAIFLASKRREPYPGRDDYVTEEPRTQLLTIANPEIAGPSIAANDIGDRPVKIA